MPLSVQRICGVHLRISPRGIPLRGCRVLYKVTAAGGSSSGLIPGLHAYPHGELHPPTTRRPAAAAAETGVAPASHTPFLRHCPLPRTTRPASHPAPRESVSPADATSFAEAPLSPVSPPPQ